MIYYSFIISGRFFQIIEINRMMLFRSKKVIKLLHSNFYYAFRWNSETAPMKNVRVTLVNSPSQALAAVFKLPCKKFSIKKKRPFKSIDLEKVKIKEKIVELVPGYDNICWNEPRHLQKYL